MQSPTDRLASMRAFLLFLFVFSLFCATTNADDSQYYTVKKRWSTLERPPNFPEAGVAIGNSEIGNLYTQKIMGYNELITWPPKLVQWEKLNRPKRPTWDQDGPFKVLLVYPSTKPNKNKPLRKWIEKLVRAAFQDSSPEAKLEFVEDGKSVPDTGVGEQPYGPMGFQGAWNRAKYCIGELTEEQKATYHAIVILSLESSLTSIKGGYDSPNVVIYELFSGELIAARGGGPAIQGSGMLDKEDNPEPDILSETIKEGKLVTTDYCNPEEEKFCGGRTYGKDLEVYFGLDSTDWQEDICGHARTPFIENLLAELEFPVVKAFGLDNLNSCTCC